jgi:hypothetical protein
LTIYFYDGKPLVFGNLVGVDQACCCDDECCCGPCVRFRWTLAGWADTLLGCGCPNVNGEYQSADVLQDVLNDGTCIYTTALVIEEPLAACDAVIVLAAEILCPVEGKIRLRGLVGELSVADLPVDPLNAGLPELLERVFADQPPLGTVALFDGEETDATCDQEIDLVRTAQASGFCSLAAASAKLQVEACPAANQLAWGNAGMFWGGEPMIWGPTPASVFESTISGDWPPAGRSKRRAQGAGSPKRRCQEDPPCVHRGAELGIADCRCGGKPAVYQCNLLQVPCVAHSPGKRIRKLVGGQAIDQPLACTLCDHYQPTDSTDKTVEP